MIKHNARFHYMGSGDCHLIKLDPTQRAIAASDRCQPYLLAESNGCLRSLPAILARRERLLPAIADPRPPSCDPLYTPNAIRHVLNCTAYIHITLRRLISLLGGYFLKDCCFIMDLIKFVFQLYKIRLVNKNL